MIKKSINHISNFGVQSFGNYFFYEIKKIIKIPFYRIKAKYREMRITRYDKRFTYSPTILEASDICSINEIIKSKEKSFNKNTKIFPRFSLKEYSNNSMTKASNVTVFGSMNLNNSNEFVENDLTYHLLRSAKEAGLHSEQFWGSTSTNSPFVMEKQRLDEFISHCEKSNTQILTLDSNLRPNQKTFNYENFLEIKKKYNLRIILFVPDFDKKKIDYWARDLADLVVTSRPSLIPSLSSTDISKIVCLPGVPYARSVFQKSHLREIDFYFSGSMTRQREIYLGALSKSEIRTKIIFGNRKMDQSPSYEQFLSDLGNAKVTFANGYINKKNHLIAGRFLEAILSETLCIYEDATELESFFIPFQHYIPVSTSTEFVKMTHYYLRECEERKNISKLAFNYWDSHYSSNRFWNFAIEHLSNV